MAKRKGPALSPIKWDVVRADGDPREAAERLAKRSPADGTVVVRATDESKVVHLSALVKMGRMKPLALGMVGAFCASEGIRKDTGIISWVRWPDLVVIGNGVVAGSTVTRLTSPGDERGILNISVNRLHAEGEGLTSLQDALGVEVDPEMLVAKTLESLSWMHFGWANGMEEHIMKRVRSMTETIDSRVSVRARGTVVKGKAETIDASGRLVIMLDSGKRLRISRSDELVED